MSEEPAQPDFVSTPAITSPIFWHFVGKMLPWLAAIAVYLVFATVLVRWDMLRIGEARPDFGAELYGMYTQLFFEPTANLPQAPIARLVFWVTPVLGVLLLVRGVVRVGASVFDVEERRKLWVKIMTDRMKGHVVVCGLGHVGIRIVESLKALGVEVVALERDRSPFLQTAERLSVPVHFGDARQDAVLLATGIARARAVVCATDNDFTNLEVAIDAKRENPDIRVVMRVFDQRVAEKVGTALDLEKTFSTSALAGPLIALQALADGVLAVYRTSTGELRVDMELAAPAAHVGKSVAECEDALDGRVVAIARAGASIRPRHDTKLEAGDVLVIDLPAGRVSEMGPLAARRAP